MVLPVMEHETSRTAAWQWFTLASSIGKSYRHSLEVISNNCEDRLYIYFFIPQFKYMNIIYS